MEKTKISTTPKRPKPPENLRQGRGLLFWILFMLGVMYLLRTVAPPVSGVPHEISYSQFYRMAAENKTLGSLKSAALTENIISGQLADGQNYTVTIPANDPDLLRVLRENVPGFTIKMPRTFFLNLIYSLGPMILFILFLYFFSYRGTAGIGGKILSFGKSRAREINTSGELKTTFNDVAGIDEAKEELKEIIDFLKDPKKFQKLGGKIPKGVLLMGPPGCGKTLIAKAVAGEAGVPFFIISGSDFVEMFVGVGASRVRDLFEQAKQSAKASGKGSIIFIDEIDAVGRLRFAGLGGGHDEREQTLNALLVEMDGFNTQEGVILIAATNRPDVLDPALLRPGRFDRQIVIDRPDIVGREGILKVHTRHIKLDKEVDLRSIARQTPGFSGADIANLANEAALLAARKEKGAVGMAELEAAIERVMAGPERKSRVISNYEKKIVAYHESGHALMSLLTPGADPLHKVSIIPRGAAALGYTMQLPLEDRYITTKSELLGRLTVLLGGRASEELTFEEITTGAHNDLEVVTEVARKMVCDFGMSGEMGHLTFGRKGGPIFLGRDIIDERNYSEETAQQIDKEVRRIVDECYAKARDVLSKHRDKLDKLAAVLLEREVLSDEEVRQILNGNLLKASGQAHADSGNTQPNA